MQEVSVPKQMGRPPKVKQTQSSETMVGNKDKEAKWPFPVKWGKSVVVRMSKSGSLTGNMRDMQEIPSSVVYQPYDAYTFDDLTLEERFKGINTIILHDPRTEE